MLKFNSVYFSVFFASLAGLISGFDTGVISGAILYIKESFSLDFTSVGMLIGCVSIGAVIGALINGLLIDKIGRKRVLILSAIIFLLGSIFCSISQNISQLIISRTFIGCAVGIVSFAAPLYLSEISKKNDRGAIVSFYQIALTFGILFSYFVNYFCSNFELNWRLMLFFGAIPSLILLIGMGFCPDSARWYVLKNEINKAREVLSNFKFQNIEQEINEIKNTICLNEKIKLNKKTLFPFIIGIGIMFVQIATGINIIIYYAPVIFKSFGFELNQDVLFVTIFIGLINFLMTFVATIFVDKIGRKPLIYFGLSGMFISLIIIGLAFLLDFSFVKYLAILACAIYIVSFSMSLGPIALLLISEVFPLKYRGQAMSIAIIFNFIFNFIVTAIFPILLGNIGGFWTFMIFALICVISILFVHFVVPETKGLSLEEIETNFN